ncbi:MAG: HD domain-containing protein [Candidatus Gastranaerophilales bacterium]|nr:HD domain-containing protein [Candidatus Gastranaerophilales bacterium]MCM1073323.1 HD domain-containing protein [Bacteroides sp.]
MNIKDDFILKNINEGYLVGGAVRDFLMGKTSVDRDIAINDADGFARNIDGTFIVLDEENKIFRVVLEDKVNFLDISELQGGSIEEDLLRRDFTINAIAYDLKNEEFIDVIGGLEDLKHGVLRHIKDENFADDPLRVLRAFRFASVTGFEMADELKAAINKYKHLLMNPSRERITYELMKLFGGKYTAKTLLAMDEFGILEEIFPQVKEMKKVPPNTHHHLDLFHHVVETVRNIEELYENASSKEKEHLDQIDFGGFPRINHLKLAGFLHDIGKFSTWTIEESGRHRFIKHDDVGSKMCVPFLRDLKFSKKQIEYIQNMIKNHIYPSNVIVAPDLNEKVMMRYLRKMEENVIDNIILAKADRLSARGEAITEEMVKDNINGLDKLLNFYLEKRETMEPLPKLLTGFEVMEIKGIKQSPVLGVIMKALNEAQMSSVVNTKDEAIEFVKNFTDF